MNATVIGGAGFIGCRLCEVLVSRGDSVTAFDKSPIRPELTRQGVTPILGDLLSENAVCLACHGTDAVFNLAGALGRWRTPVQELESANTVAPGFLVTCMASMAAGRVIHVSTTGVTGPLPDGVDASEDYPPNPVTDYQQTKLAGEQAAINAHKEAGVPLVIVRPGFVYGPGDRHKLSLFKTIAKGRMILVNEGKSRLHPTFVDDLVEGLIVASEKAPGNGEAYNIAGPRPVTTRELVETIADAVGVPRPQKSLSEGTLLRVAGIAESIGRILHREPPITRSRVKLLSESYACSIEKARRELGFEPKVDLTEGIRRTVEWYRRQGLI